MFWFFLFFGIFLIAIGVYVIWATGQCKKEIKGIYVKANKYSGGKGQSRYAPVFRYIFEGQEYERQTSQSFSKKYLDKTYEFGEEYSIFISEKRPMLFVVKPKVQGTFYLVIVLGIIFLLMAFGVK